RRAEEKDRFSGTWGCLFGVAGLKVVLAEPCIDFVARREPYVVMAGDVVERAHQMLCSERLSRKKGMDHDGHESRVGFAFGIQHVELIDDHVAENACGLAQVEKGGHIVELKGIGHADQAAGFS